MTATNGWPGKPGVPMNPEKDGWHWLKTPDNEVIPFEWRVEGECERGHWPSYWVRQGEDCWTAEECEYIGPCLTPDEATVLQKRVAELEAALRFIKDAPDEERKPNFDNMGSYEAGLRYCAAFARAALTGVKDE